MAATSTNANGPICILTPCSNSHPFEERRIVVSRSEEDAVKIGRSVVRLQPSSNNAIFDCKVLSRNHAILWMNAIGQFMIKDTRSSNGTFINNERLSASGEENEPRELFSGDILQLGVEIVDNAKKVASGCVTCIVRLLNERGEECAGRPKTEHGTFPTLLQQIPHNYTLVKNDKLFILDQYIKEATHRENLLGLKLQTLEEQLRVAQEALQTKWQEHVDQELLLSRIEQLESQLDRKVKSITTRMGGTNSTSKTGANDGNAEQLRLATELRELAEDRGRIEQMAKESLRAMQEQVQETAMKLHDAEMSLINVEEECTFLRQRCIDFEAQMSRQRDEYDAILVKYNSINDLLHNRIEPATTVNINNSESKVEQQQDNTKMNSIESVTITVNDCVMSTSSFNANDVDVIVDTNGMASEQDDRQQIGNEARNSANDLVTMEQIWVMQEQVDENVIKLHAAEKNLTNKEMECTFLQQRCEKFETQLSRQRNDYNVLRGSYNMACGFAMLAMALYAYSSLESIFIIFAFVIFFWSIHHQRNDQPLMENNNTTTNVVVDELVGESQFQQQEQKQSTNAGEDEQGNETADEQGNETADEQGNETASGHRYPNAEEAAAIVVD